MGQTTIGGASKNCRFHDAPLWRQLTYGLRLTSQAVCGMLLFTVAWFLLEQRMAVGIFLFAVAGCLKEFGRYLLPFLDGA